MKKILREKTDEEKAGPPQSILVSDLPDRYAGDLWSCSRHNILFESCDHILVIYYDDKNLGVDRVLCPLNGPGFLRRNTPCLHYLTHGPLEYWNKNYEIN